MKNSFFPILLLCGLLASCFENKVADNPDNKETNAKKENNSTEIADRKNFKAADLTYNGQKVKVSKHGRCRMDCRQLDAYEIQEVINNGKKNPKKSSSESKPCPTIALEGMTSDGQNARIVLGLCDNDYKIVTVIDLKNDWKCDCY